MFAVKLRKAGVALIGACTAILLLTACKGTPQAVGANPGGGGPTPTYRELASAHNERVAKLKELYAIGVIELRWKDASGHHFQQGDMELWIQQPRRTALRVEKLGEVLVWVGSDDRRFWSFDLTGKEKVLLVGDHDAADLDGELGGAFGVRPLRLLDLMAITPMRTDLSPEPTVEFDGKLDAWVMSTPDRGGMTRMYLDRRTRFPVRVELLNADGKILVFSRLDLKRYDSAKTEGVSTLAYPKMAFMIDIATAESPAGADDPEGKVKIAIGEAFTAINPEEAQRLFDLPNLIKGMKPDRIEGNLPAAPSAGPGAADSLGKEH